MEEGLFLITIAPDCYVKRGNIVVYFRTIYMGFCRSFAYSTIHQSGAIV